MTTATMLTVKHARIGGTFTREITFTRIGLHTSGIADLVAYCDDQIDLAIAVQRHIAHYLAPSTKVKVKTHPDDPHGFVYECTKDGGTGRLLGTFTLALPQAESRD